jgi:hypothetical protein
MTFLPELKRLMDAATNPVDTSGTALCTKVRVDLNQSEWDFLQYLGDHAPALAELVEAAEKVIEWTGNEQLREALAKLNANDAAAIRKLKVAE